MASNFWGALKFDTGPEMREVPRDKWPIMPGLESEPLSVWLSNEFMAVLYRQRVGGALRLCVNKTRRNGRDWRDGITWDELQRIKDETVGPDVWCIENYPSADKVVNVSNMRHLYLLDEPPAQRFPEEAYISDDELTAALDAIRAAMRHGECEWTLKEKWPNRDGDDHVYGYETSCGARHTWWPDSLPNFCPTCGNKVKAAKR